MFANNTCITATTSVHAYAGCDPKQSYNPTGGSPLNANNSYLTTDGSAIVWCGRTNWSLADAALHGWDVGSNAGPAPAAEEIVLLAEQLLDLGF